MSEGLLAHLPLLTIWWTTTVVCVRVIPSVFSRSLSNKRPFCVTLFSCASSTAVSKQNMSLYISQNEGTCCFRRRDSRPVRRRLRWCDRSCLRSDCMLQRAEPSASRLFTATAPFDRNCGSRTLHRVHFVGNWVKWKCGFYIINLFDKQQRWNLNYLQCIIHKSFTLSTCIMN